MTWKSRQRGRRSHARRRKLACPQRTRCGLIRHRWSMRLFGRQQWRGDGWGAVTVVVGAQHAAPLHSSCVHSLHTAAIGYPIAAVPFLSCRHAIPALRARRIAARRSETYQNPAGRDPAGAGYDARLAQRAWLRRTRHRDGALVGDRHPGFGAGDGVRGGDWLACERGRRERDRHRRGRQLRAGGGPPAGTRRRAGALPLYGGSGNHRPGAPRRPRPPRRGAADRGERDGARARALALPRHRRGRCERGAPCASVDWPRHSSRKRIHHATSKMTDYALTFSDVTGRGLGPVSLALLPGEIAGLVGPAGAGKTRLLRVAAGSLKPRTGEARVWGMRVTNPAARRLIGYACDSPAFPCALTVEEVLTYYARLDCADNRERSARGLVRDALEIAGLTAATDLRADTLGRADL